MLSAAVVARYVWAGPATGLGLLVVLFGSWRARIRLVEGVIEAHGPVLAWGLAHLTLLDGGAQAMTIGHVVVGRSARALDASRLHEREHVGQYERWGPFFIPAYLAGSLWAAARGHHYYHDNPFEVDAVLAERSRTPSARA